MREAIKEQVKKVRKSGVELTVDNVMGNVDQKNLNTILNSGWTLEEIRGMIQAEIDAQSVKV